MSKWICERKQRSLVESASYSGIGIHTGKEVTLRLCPAEEGQGVFFKRVDLPGHPIIPVCPDSIVDTSRSTNLGKNGAKIHTVEHVLAALKAYDIDNVCIEIDSMEPPGGNGSSDVFVEMIEQAGILEQNQAQPIYSLDSPLFYSDGDVHLIALPSNEYRISYTLHYPQTPAIRSQYFSIAVSSESFKNEISKCRTFALYEEISYLMDRGLIKGGSLDNAVIIKDQAVLSKGGLFFPDEMVRHKILDLIGDLSVVGIPFLAHIIAIRSGHASNAAFAKQIHKQFLMESIGCPS